MAEQLSQRLKRWLEEHLSASADFISQELKHGEAIVHLVYFKSICDEERIRKLIVQPFYENIVSPEHFAAYVDSIAKQKSVKSEQDLLQSIMQGTLIVLVHNSLFLIDVKKNVNNSVGDTSVENSILGTKKAFGENLEVNVNIIRTRYPLSSLTVETTTVGTLVKTPVALIFDRELVEERVLEEVKESLKTVKTGLIQSGSQLQRDIAPRKRTLFPTQMITERPDRSVFNLSQGKVLLLLDGSPFAVIMPAVFYDFMSAVDDMYEHFWVSRFLLIIRYAALLISLTLSALYVAVTSYNPDFLRVQLALSIAGSRAPVPYPSYIEVLFMLLIVELLVEASIRLPRAIGSTATTVGGLILGQAASQAGLVSNIMIIVVATVAISSFVVPINEMSASMRVAKYFILAVTTVFGFVGLLVSFILLVAYLVHLDSFGQPYLKLFRENPNNERQVRRME
ncbi:spore germination protein [Paenibacillus thermotolerans]|uniref:spore germination protein n=1 Tax=Paenibacillus thermotolerans TaxID=3027807 RepID=UPI0023688E95|nr:MULTISPECIES: spore germination protein [unclassified Paenibacillus]